MGRFRIVLAALPALLALGPQGLAPAVADSNPFPRAECVYWAYQQRPDIYRAVQSQGWHQNWDAWRWLSYARSAGLGTGSRPATGAIAVWPPDTAGADAYGHVAFVERVSRGGGFVVSEYNWSVPGGFDRRSLQTAPAGLHFIYADRAH